MARRLRIPPNATGRNVVCPKCKNKMRVPDIASGAPAATTKSDSDTIALSDTPSSGTDLGGGMLDMLGDDGLAAEPPRPRRTREPVSRARKLSGGKSKSGAIFGLPPIALYGGAAAVALVFALGLVYLLGGFSGGSSQVAQTPSMPPAGPTSNPPAAPPPASNAPTASSPAAPAPSQPTVPAPAMPSSTTPPSTSPPAAPTGSFSAGLAGGLRNKAQAEAAAAGGGVPPASPPGGAATLPANTASMPAGSPPAADASSWKQRMPTVCAVRSQPRAGETATSAASGKRPVELLQGIQGAQNQVIENLKQVTDVETATRIAGTYAEQTAKGLTTCANYAALAESRSRRTLKAADCGVKPWWRWR